MGMMVTATSITAMAVPILRAFASQGIVRQSAETGVVPVRCCVSACGEMVSEPPPWIDKAGCFSAPPAAAPAVWLKTCCSGHRLQVSTLAVKKKKESLDFSLDNGTGEDDEVIGDMEEWINNKPGGFGNKVYDTALEDKLLAEIEHDKKSRMAAAMGLKENNGKSNGKKSGKPGKAIRAEAAPPAGVEVWVGNLPRKKNVDRDLWAALRSVEGLLHVRPIVFAQNEKTQEPLCKGYAFLTFKTDGDALDFVAKYHGTNITFGRVEKKLACEVAGSDSPWSPTKLTTQTAVTAATGVPKLHVRDNEAAISLAFPSTGTTQHSALISDSRNEPLDASVVPVNSHFDTASFETFDDEEDEEQLRALEDKIWVDLEDEADDLLDMELEDESQKTESALEDIKVCDDPPMLRSTLHDQRVLGHELDNDWMTQHSPVDVDMAAGHASEDHAKNESVSSEKNQSRQSMDMTENDAGIYVTVTAGKTSKNISEGSHKEGEKGDDEVKRILELELRVRQMERELKEKDAKLQQVAAVEQERIEMLEKRVLGKFKAIAAGTRATKTKSEGASTGKKKGPKAVNRKTKSVKPMITLGSANRLKLKERKVLTDVMSKYAADPAEGVIS